MEQEVEQAFLKFDLDRNGTLDVEEAAKFLEDWFQKNSSSELAKEVQFDDIDINGDGVISREELKKFLYDQRMIQSELF